LVEKEIISPATYWYREEATGLPRKLVVTPELTRHWCERGNEMLGLGLTVPVPCEHDFDAHPMTPADKLKNNAGWVREYRLKDVDDRKDVLFGVVDVQDEELARKLPKTIRWTSPWISSFTDGQGKEWKNVISHLALTTRPRIVKQAPFPSVAAALSLATEVKVESASAQGFCLSRAGRLVEDGAVLRPAYPIAFSLYGGVALAGGPSPKAKPRVEPPDDDGDSEDSDDLDLDGGDEAEDFGDQNGDVSMEELLADLLGALGIHLERSGGEEAFKRSLYNATMTKIHELTGKAQGQGDKMSKPNTPPNQGQPNPLVPQQEQQPMYMSLEEINKLPDPMRGVALAMHAENVKLRTALDANAKQTASLQAAKLAEENAKRASRVELLKKCMPSIKADLDAMLALPSMALSMGEGGAVVDPMAQMLGVLEKGLADMPRLLTTPADQIVALAQPTDGEMSAEATNKLADDLSRMMGYPAEEKKAG
jgi:hypothetical protein